MPSQKKRNIFGLLIVLLLTIPTLTTISWLNYQKKEVKREVKLKLKTNTPKQGLVELNFNFYQLINLTWKKKHEFQLHGKMYDIVYSEINDGIVTYWCWLDKEETALNAKLDNLLQIALTGNNSKRSKEYQLELFLKSMIVQEVITFDLNTNSNKEELSNIESFYQSIDLNITSPPPELI